MDQQTDLMQTLAKLRAEFERPPSPMEIIRTSLRRDADRKPDVPIFSDEQRATLAADLGKIEAFINSPDGRDAVALLVATFEAFEHAGDAPAEEDEGGENPRPHSDDR